MYDYANVGQSAHFADYRDADRQTGRDAFRILHPLGRTVCDQANIEERGKQKMLKRLVRGIITIIGAVAGYGVFLLFGLWMKKNGTDISTVFTDAQLIGIGIVFAILFGIIFFRLTPAITRQSAKVADNIDHDLKEVSANEILMGTIGLILGLIIAYLVTQIFSEITNKYVLTVINLILYLGLGYLGAVIASRKSKDLFSMIAANAATRKQAQGQNQAQNLNLDGAVPSGTAGMFTKSKKKSDSIPKILDTSVIIDGRIADILKTGFLEGPIVIPEFVLVELRHIADSSDSLKRTRGRRGLDILNKIQQEYGIEIYNTDNEKSLKEIPEVDVKLLKLAQLINGKVVTNDYNLNKVAAINGVSVLNINELANTLKPVVLPGEKMSVNLVKQGKDNSQAIAYLDDGTMIVVEDGRKMIGKTTEINVTSVLQTSAGRMIFGRLRN